MAYSNNSEIIIRQHRRWTLRVEENHTVGEGNLILTNYRLLFLHRIEASPAVSATIKELANATIENVLNHALTLHKNSFQIPLTSIMQVGCIALFGFPFPRFRLSIIYLKGKNLSPHTTDFIFKTAKPGVFAQPQLITDLIWQRAIRKAIQRAGHSNKQ